MLKIRFWSDSNLDGFVQSISTGGFEPDSVDVVNRIVTAEDVQLVHDEVADWGGELL